MYMRMLEVRNNLFSKVIHFYSFECQTGVKINQRKDAEMISTWETASGLDRKDSLPSLRFIDFPFVDLSYVERAVDKKEKIAKPSILTVPPI